MITYSLLVTSSNFVVLFSKLCAYLPLSTALIRQSNSLLSADDLHRGVLPGGLAAAGHVLPGTPDLEFPKHGTFPRVQAICIAACFPDDWPLLVVCPSSLRLQWYDALLTWAPPALLPPPDQIAIVAAGKVGRPLNLLIILMLKFWSGPKRSVVLTWTLPALLLPPDIVAAGKVGVSLSGVPQSAQFGPA